MTSDRDIYASANLLIKQHGKDAAIFATMQANACGVRDDHAGKATWVRIIRAIEELKKAPPKNPSALH